MPTTTTTTTKTFTLSDLVKIALGAPELTNEHLSVLQNLLIILLQKLNCHNEVITIQGFPARNIQKLLDVVQTDSCQYDFQLKSLKSLKEKYELLEKLEQKKEEFQLRIEEHFNQIRNCHKTNIFKAEIWDSYASSNEDLCTLYMTQNKEFCLLIRNPIFNMELRYRISYPLVEHVKECETKMEKMQQKLQKIIEMANQVASKQNYVESIVKDIENVRTSIANNNKTFREAILESQEMLNCKLDRVALPAIRKYLEQRFLNIEEYLKILKIEANRRTPTKPMTIEKSTCLSYTRHKDLKHLRYLKPLKSINDMKKCFCSNLIKEPTILEKLDRTISMPYKSITTTASVHRCSIQRSDEVTDKLKFLKADDEGHLQFKSQSEENYCEGAIGSKNSITSCSQKFLDESIRQNSKSKSVRLSGHIENWLMKKLNK